MASTPFKFDHVGSFLRPESLKKARRDYEAGSITAEELKSVEDEAITELIKKEKEVGLHAITDEGSEEPNGILILCGHLME